jgi:hypothetical protein
MYREERVELGRYGDEELSDVVDQLETGARMLARTVAVLTSEQFGRTGIYGYPAVGTRTLSWVAAQALHEMLHHADDITAQLAPHQGSLDLVRAAPSNQGTLELIVSRPDIDQREVLDAAVLDARQGLIGDSWITRGSRRTADGSADPEDQVNIMSASAARLLCGDRDRWAQAGDQLFVDFDLSAASLPAGSRLRIGEAVVEISARPHRGCAKFAERFGRDALRLVNSAEGRALNLRGVNAKIINGGTIRTGDRVSRSLPRQSGRGGVVED